MVDIVLEVFVGRHLGQDLLDDALVVGEDLVEGVGTERVARQQVDELTEGETAQVIGFHDAVELGVLVLQPHHAAAREDDLQVRVEVIALAELDRPVRLFEHLVDEQHASAVSVEFSCKVGDTLALKIEVVHVDIQALLVLYIEMFLRVLQQKRCFAHTTRTLDTDHTVGPVNLVHQRTADRGFGMLH